MRAAPPFHFQRLIANCQTAHSGMLFFVNLVIFDLKGILCPISENVFIISSTLSCDKENRRVKERFMKKLDLATYRNKVNGCWAGKNIGGVLGAPFEAKRGVITAGLPHRFVELFS